MSDISLMHAACQPASIGGSSVGGLYFALLGLPLPSFLPSTDLLTSIPPGESAR